MWIELELNEAYYIKDLLLFDLQRLEEEPHKDGQIYKFQHHWAQSILHKVKEATLDGEK